MQRGRMALAALLLACADTPHRPTPAAPVDGHQALVAWFAQRGITLPDQPPHEPAAKVAQDDERLLGDGSGNGRVNYWDVALLYGWLRGFDAWVKRFEARAWAPEAFDIDRDGDADWFDLALLGDYLYGSGDNPHGIGGPLVLPDATFDIELVFVGSLISGTSLSARDQRLARRAADRWERVITGGVEDTHVEVNTQDWDWWDGWTNLDHDFAFSRTVDDLLIFVGANEHNYSSAGSFFLTTSHRPILGEVSLSRGALSLSDAWTENYFLHEIAHVLGIGQGKAWLDLLGAPSRAAAPTVDTYFFGAAARAAFNRAGGRYYRGNKVPVENGGDNSHWRESVFGSELMSLLPFHQDPEPLSEVTLHALADLGYYQVDVSQAESYTLPPASKPVATTGLHNRCRVLRLPPQARMH